MLLAMQHMHIKTSKKTNMKTEMGQRNVKKL